MNTTSATPKTSSPKSSAAMLLTAASHHHHHQHTTIKTPKHGSPKYSTLGLSGATTMPSTSTLILDNQGQAHDPGYLDALRQLHAKIGEGAITPPHSRRRPSSAHAPARPSALGLGLSSNMAGLDLSTDSSSGSDEDDDYDSYNSLFEEAARRDAATSRAMRYASSQRISPSSTPAMAATSSNSSSGYDSLSNSSLTSPPLAPKPRYTGRPHSSGGRHLSFSTNADLDAEMTGGRERRSSWSARRLSSPQRGNGTPTMTSSSPAPPPNNSSARETASGPGLAASSRGGDDWGFTGIVDVERERSSLARAASVDPNLSTPRLTAAALLEEAVNAPSAPDSPSLVAAASLNRSKLHTPESSPLAQESLIQGAANKLRASSFSQHRNKTLSKKASSSDVASMSSGIARDAANASPASVGNGMPAPSNSRHRKSHGESTAIHPSPLAGTQLNAKSPSLRQKLSARTGTSRSRPSSSSSVPLFGGAERPRNYISTDGDHSGLVTIQSGKTLTDDNPRGNLLAPWGMVDPAAEHSTRSEHHRHSHRHAPPPSASLNHVKHGQQTPSSSSDVPATGSGGDDDSSADGFGKTSPPAHITSLPTSARQSISSLTREQLEADLQQQQEEADFVMGPSRVKQGMDALKKKGHDVTDVGTQSYELRRKYEMFTMNLRFNAFKAKQKLRRGFDHHET